MKTPLLSICIATYNRASYIGETLDSIIPQLDDDVELLVVDGASTDNTEDVVRKFVKKESRIRYVRLSAKGGVDKDYDKSVELARGEFCWLFTDDDLLKSGAVAAVKTAIKEGHDLLVVNAEVRDRELSVILERQRIIMQDNKLYSPNEMECLFIDALSYISFIGAVVIRRSLWLSRERESYFGTEFVHVGVIFQKPLPETALIIAEPYIIIRFGNAQWTSRIFDVWMFKWPKLVWSFPEFSDSVKRKVCRREPWRSAKALFHNRALGSYTTAEFRMFCPSDTGKVERVIAYILSIIPASLANLVMVFYFSILAKPAHMALYDLLYSRNAGMLSRLLARSLGVGSR
jgi:glycosyltransferase involved in cell wall biosynthesis